MMNFPPGIERWPDHMHNYQPVRTETTVVRDRGKLWEVTYTFLECLNPGCPRPDTVEVTRRAVLWAMMTTSAVAAGSACRRVPPNGG
jgi:hypothetical protein